MGLRVKTLLFIFRGVPHYRCCRALVLTKQSFEFEIWFRVKWRGDVRQSFPEIARYEVPWQRTSQVRNPAREK
jgi:hypothetical protein